MVTFSSGAGSEPSAIQGVPVLIQEGKEVTESRDVSYIWVYLLLPQVPSRGNPKFPGKQEAGTNGKQKQGGQMTFTGFKE